MLGSGFDLCRDGFGHLGLDGVVLATVRVAAVDHDPFGRAGLGEGCRGVGDGLGVVVGSVATTAQDHVAVPVAAGGDDGRHSLLRHREEVMGVSGGADGVDGDLEVAVGAVLEADGHGEARRELAVDLALGGAGADGTPGDEVGDELRGDRVEKFATRRDALIRQLEE